jgi:seryl-tRNA synthetase
MDMYLEQQSALVRNENLGQDDLITFKNKVNEWLSIDEQIKRLATDKRQYFDRKKELSKEIADFMTQNNIEDLNTSQGIKIRLKTTSVKEPLTQDAIKTRVTQYFGEVRDPNELNERIFSNRQTTEKSSLRLLKKA